MPRGPRGVNARHVPLALRREMTVGARQALETQALSAYFCNLWFDSGFVENDQILRVDCPKPATY
jgi:hypothetical protein